MGKRNYAPLISEIQGKSTSSKHICIPKANLQIKAYRLPQRTEKTSKGRNIQIHMAKQYTDSITRKNGMSKIPGRNWAT